MTEDQIKEIAGIAWKGAANAHRLYPNNKHTFSDYWEGAKSQFDQFSTPKEEVKELPGVQDWINEGKRIDAILEDFHQKKIDMLEVRKQILEPLFHKVFSTDSTLSPEQSTPKIEVVDTPTLGKETVDKIIKILHFRGFLTKNEKDQARSFLLRVAVTKEKESNGEELVEAYTHDEIIHALTYGHGEGIKRTPHASVLAEYRKTFLTKLNKQP
jgi:hypothetical protein